MWEPALRSDDIEAERTVILDEILMHADEPADLAAERWQCRPLPGPPARARHARDGVVGAADHPRGHPHVLRAPLPPGQHGRVGGRRLRPRGRSRPTWSERFAGISGGAAPARTAPGPDSVPLDVVRRSTEQAHLVYGMRSVSRFDERRWALAVLNHVLGGGLSSRLFQKVREQRGLAYSVWSERAAYADAGSLAVVVGTAPEHVDEVLRIVNGELELLAERRRDRPRAGGRQGQPARRDAALGRGLGSPHEPHRCLAPAARRGALGRRGPASASMPSNGRTCWRRRGSWRTRRVR